MNYLSVFETILNSPAEKIDRRGWATFFCPFHNDVKTPNLGVNIYDGHWRCLACNAAGPSPAVLAKKLGKDYKYINDKPVFPQNSRELSPIYPAFRETQKHIGERYSREYLSQRGISLHFARFLGMGYGFEYKITDELTKSAAEKLHMTNAYGGWLWYKALMYGEPPHKPVFIQARFTDSQDKRFRFLSWGEKLYPLGYWLIGNFSPRNIYLVEGMFDMIALNQAFAKDGFRSVAIATAGASLSHHILTCIEDLKKFKLIVIPDNDEAGEDWLKTLREVKRGIRVVRTPDGLDPDQAVLKYGTAWL